MVKPILNDHLMLGSVQPQTQRLCFQKKLRIVRFGEN